MAGYRMMLGRFAAVGAMTVLTAVLTPGSAADLASRAGLSAEQITQLQALGMPIALPTDVPDAFEVVAVETEAGDVSGSPPHYRIIYADDGAICFGIESASGAVGGPVPDSRWAVYPFAFLPSGDSPWYVYFTRHAPRPPFFPYVVFSDWLRRGKWLYRLSSGFQRTDNCGAIGPRTAARIVESLAFLDTAPSLRVGAFEPLVRYRPFSFQSSAHVDVTQAAAEAIDSLGLTLARALHGMRVLARLPDVAWLLVSQSHLQDDSVAARRYRLTLVRQGPNWVLQDIAVQRRCYRAQERDWSAALCP